MDTVIRTGKIFEVGNFEDKSFNFTESDLSNAVAAFKPVPVDLEHIPTVLEGKLGHVERIFSDDGKTLMGEVHLPPWLDTLLEDGQRKVSATWDRASKQLLGLALVRSPRVSDAALMAAFSADAAIPADLLVLIESLPDKAEFAKHNTMVGQDALQHIHDVAAQHGAVCNKPAAMASRHENAAIQKTHDVSVEHGAKCQSIQPGQSMPAMYSNVKPRRKAMPTLKEILFGTAQQAGIEDPTAEIEALFSNDDSKVTALEAKLAAQEAENTRLREAQEAHSASFSRMEAETRTSAAAAFAKEQVTAGRISPAAQGPLAALTVRILETDATATFAEGEKSNTVLLKEVLDALESDFKLFTKNTVGDDAGPFAALFAETKTPGVGDVEARDEILKKMRNATPAGRQIEKEKQNGNHA